MDAEILTPRPGLLHEHVGGDVPHLANDVELAQAVEASVQFRECLELVAVRGADARMDASGLPDRAPVVHRSSHTAAP